MHKGYEILFRDAVRREKPQEILRPRGVRTSTHAERTEKRLVAARPRWLWGVLFVLGVGFGMTLRGEAEADPEPALEPSSEKYDANNDYLLAKDVLLATVAALQELTQTMELPNPPKSNLQAEPTHGVQVVTAKRGVRLRETPSEGARIVAVLERGTVLFADALREGWMAVRSPLGAKAWVRRDLVRYTPKTLAGL